MPHMYNMTRVFSEAAVMLLVPFVELENHDVGSLHFRDDTSQNAYFHALSDTQNIYRPGIQH